MHLLSHNAMSLLFTQRCRTYTPWAISDLGPFTENE